MTPCGDDIYLDQHWLRQWLAARWHQAITWPNVELSSVRSSDTHCWAISQEIPQPSINKLEKYSSKIAFKSPRGQWVKAGMVKVETHIHIQDSHWKGLLLIQTLLNNQLQGGPYLFSNSLSVVLILIDIFLQMCLSECIKVWPLGLLLLKD